jgi:hypothetical protein
VHSINILQRLFYIYSRDQSIYDFNIVMVGLVFVYIRMLKVDSVTDLLVLFVCYLLWLVVGL